jgi:photosystem II stability/assembly factor-like uncharacterized protein
MPEHDDDLSAALQEYYAAMARQPAPDVTGRVMMSADRRNARIRRWGAIGGGVLAAAAVGGVVAIALVNHNQSAPIAPAHSSTSGPTATAAPPSPSATPSSPTASPPAVGQPVHGFVPTDVTASSAADWWVIGYNGPSCSSASCTRILHTTDAGHTFTSIPVPPVAPAQNGQQALRLRFANASDGWVVTAGGDVWATYNGGAEWTDDGVSHQVTDLESSGNSVYAIACLGSCWIQKSPIGHDSWMVLPASEGTSQLGHLNVHGTDVWATINSPGGGTGALVVSTDGGQSFGKYVVCTSALGYPDLYAVDSATLWATCATGTEAAAYRSVDGGHSFSQLTAAMPLPNFATIAGVSQTTAVIAGQTLARTTDGGQSFATVEGNQSQWAIVGFTTQQNGFAFNIGGAGRSELQRTDDAGAHWHQVTFP